MSEKKKAKGAEKFTKTEWLILIVLLAVALALAVSAFVRFAKTKGQNSLPEEVILAEKEFEKNRKEAIGTLPPSEEGLLLFDEESGKVILAEEEQVSYLFGYPEGEKFFLFVEYEGKEYLLATYSETLKEDFRQMVTLPVTARVNFLTQGIERDFIFEQMAKNYSDACFVEENGLYCYTAAGKTAVSEPSSFLRAFVSSRLSDSVLSSFTRLSSLDEVSFYDTGDYYLRGDALFSDGGGTLCYALPYAKEVVCPSETYVLTKGCLKNARRVERISIPYTGQSLIELFGGKIPASLTRVEYTSSVFGEEPTEKIEGVEIVWNIQ